MGLWWGWWIDGELDGSWGEDFGHEVIVWMGAVGGEWLFMR